MTAYLLAALDMAGTTVDEGGLVYAAVEAAVAEAVGGPVPAELMWQWKGTRWLLHLPACLPACHMPSASAAASPHGSWRSPNPAACSTSTTKSASPQRNCGSRALTAKPRRPKSRDGWRSPPVRAGSRGPTDPGVINPARCR